jgi:elongation factor P
LALLPVFSFLFSHRVRAQFDFIRDIQGAFLMAISTSDFKTGLTIEYEGNVFQIIEFQHVKPGKGGAFVRSRLRNLMTGAALDKTWRAGERMEQALVERRNVDFLYRDGDDLVFMDMDDYEEMRLPSAQVGDSVKFLKDNTTVQLMTWKNQLLNLELPQTMEFVITQTDPGLRGDTAQGGSKPATLETGAVVTVPLFVNEGEVIRVDTRSGQYIERAK